MPRVCPDCDGRRTALKPVTLKWWERLLGRPDLVPEDCRTCNATGRVPGTREEEEAYAAKQLAEQEGYAARRAAAATARERSVPRPLEPLTEKDKMLIFSVLGGIATVFLICIAIFGFHLAMKYTLATIGVVGLMVGAFGKNQTFAGIGVLAITASWFFF